MKKNLASGLLGVTVAVLVSLAPSLWDFTPLERVTLLVFVLGAVGGLVKGIISQGGLQLPSRLPIQTKLTENGSEVTVYIWQPGVIGTVFIGGTASLLTWGMFGPLKDLVVVGPQPPNSPPVTLSLVALAMAAVVGFGGATIWTAMADKKFLRVAAAAGAAGQPDLGAALAAQNAAPRELAARLTGSPDAAKDLGNTDEAPPPDPKLGAGGGGVG